MFPRVSLLALTAAFLLTGTQANPCPPTASTLPSTKSPSNSKIVKEVLGKIQADLTNITSALNTTGIAIGVKSIHEDKPLFEFYHTPAVAATGSTKDVNIDTVFRGGSITKLFTVLSALQNPAIKGSDPVTKYVPQLKRDVFKNEGSFSPVPWDNITVDDLASHVSGIGRDIATDLAVFTKGPWEKMGLPPVANETRPKCSGFANTETCTKEDLLTALNRKPLVFRPHSTPVYTNIGISLLGLVVEAATNKTWDAVLNETILKPLGLTNTSTTGPASDSWGFIPKGEETWGAATGIYTAAGGIYTNTRDLLSFGTAVLSNKLKIDSASWLKPRGFTSSSGVSIGAPWEILSTTTLLPSGVPIYIYTKAGDIGSYSNVLFLIPDYDLVASILTAGPATQNFQFPAQVMTPVISALLPALENANKEAAAKAFSGTYTDPETKSTLTISTDDGPGLSLSNLTVRGFDVLPNIPNYSTSPSEKTYNVTARIYPTNMKDGEKWSWRAIYKNHDEDEVDDKLFFPQGGCQTWALVDHAAYNYLGLDDFTITVGEDGTAKSISPRPFGVTLTRAKA